VSTKLRVLALMHRHLVPPDTIPEGTDLVSAPWRTEYDVMSTLKAMGHEVQPLAVHDDLGDIRRAATEWKPHIAFNLLEGFDDITIFEQNVVSHLELLKLSYPGCNPRGLLLSRDNSLSKKLLAYHRIRVFAGWALPMPRPASLVNQWMLNSGSPSGQVTSFSAV
jgi:D-alanine-D-alanine ligase